MLSAFLYDPIFSSKKMQRFFYGVLNMFKTTSLRQFSERNNKRILNKPNKLTLLSSASLLTLAACDETTTPMPTPTSTSTPTPTPTPTTTPTPTPTPTTTLATTPTPTPSKEATDGDDWLVGGAGDDILDGLAGADKLYGEGGIDTADYSHSDDGVKVVLDEGATVGIGGHAKGDRLFSIENVMGTAYADTITGDANNNAIWSYGGNDVLYGGAGDDTLDGGAGADELYGGDGDDILDGGLGSDILDGGDGIDTVDYSKSNDIVEVSLSNLTTTFLINADGGHAFGDTFFSIENLIGSAYNDYVFGGSSDNYIWGNDGDDRLYGQAGDDTLNGGAGADILDGGEGIDTADYSNSDEGVELILDEGSATGIGGHAAEDTLFSIENIIGSANVDTITGDANDNVIWGNDGNDHLYGGEGSDTLNGGDGNDTLEPGSDSFDDTIDGGDGFDTVELNGDGFYFKINKAANTIDITVSHTGFADSVDSITSIETFAYDYHASDMKDLYGINETFTNASTEFLTEGEFLYWLGNDAGYNYEGLG
ncbi:MAG: hypothetical protein COB24_12990 [Hyphomicrobiales bacterium]|nr:MAG: hypothetical protein COB24_12990 [Hyphomicrobiales bacterium]